MFLLIRWTGSLGGSSAGLSWNRLRDGSHLTALVGLESPRWSQSSTWKLVLAFGWEAWVLLHVASLTLQELLHSSVVSSSKIVRPEAARHRKG